MKKVGILSMQRIYNYGSFLQAYALKKILEDLECDVQFVDYHPGECIISQKKKQGFRHKISKAIEVLTVRTSLKNKFNYIKYKRNFAVNFHHFLGIDNSYNYSPKLDVLIIGSDEVFNCIQNNPNVGFSPELFGVGNQAVKLTSYAASFGNTTIQRLKQYNMEENVADWLRAFDEISVRDDNSYQIVNELTGRYPEIHLDPVLVYGYLKKCSMIPKNVPHSKYLLLYGYSGRFSREECDAVRSYVKKRGMKILCIGGIQHCCDEFIECTPFEVFAYFKNANAVITDTFHGTILSIITHQKFGTFVRESGYGNAEKVSDLLARLGVKEQIISDVGVMEHILEHSIDYQQVDNIISVESDRTYGFLKRLIGKENECNNG